MLPVCSPSDTSGYRKVFVLTDVSALVEWVDYIPIQAAAQLAVSAGRTDALGYEQVNSLASNSGLTAFKDYVPVYLDGTKTKAWSTDPSGYIPMYAEVGTISSINNDWLTPDNWSHTEEWTDGGATYDLNAVIVGWTAARLTSFDLDETGVYLLAGNISDDVVTSYELSTPFDFSTATETGEVVFTNGADVMWMEDGEYYAAFSSVTLVLYMVNCVTPYVVPTTFVIDSQITKAQMGSTDTEVGSFWVARDGTSVYMFIEKASVTYLARADLATPYNLGSFTNLADISTNATFAGIAVTDGFQVSADERYIYASGPTSNTVIRGEMSTPGDISTLTWDTTNIITHVTSDHVWVNSAFTKMITNNDGTGSPELNVFELA